MSGRTLNLLTSETVITGPKNKGVPDHHPNYSSIASLPIHPKMSKKASSKLTKSNLEDVDPRRIVGVTAERVTHVSSTDYPGHYPHEDHSWNLDTFKKVCR